jgi:DNA gyrase subunit A
VISRNTQGVKLIGMDSDEKVAGAARLAESEESESEESESEESENGDTENGDVEKDETE